MLHRSFVATLTLGVLATQGCDEPNHDSGGWVSSAKGSPTMAADLQPNQLVSSGEGLAVYDPTDFIIRDHAGHDVRIQSAEGPKGEACTIDLSSFVALYEWEAYGDGAIGGAPPVADRPKWVSMLKSEEGGQTRCSGGCGGGTVSECCRVLIGSEAQ